MRRLLHVPNPALRHDVRLEANFQLFQSVLHFYQSYRCVERGLMMMYPAKEKSEFADESFRREVKLRLL